MKTVELENILKKYVPAQSVSWVAAQINQHAIHLNIKGGRSSKLGDYRAPYGGKGHRISVNLELNKEEFLVTFVHELAHLVCFNKHQNKVRPHGHEWKQCYIMLLKECIELDFFEASVVPYLLRHINAPGATSCSDPDLRKALRGDEGNEVLEVKDLAAGERFILGKHIFEKGELQRTRYRCLNLQNKRYYLVQKHAQISAVPQNTDPEV